jgi:hypothetical protein
MSSIHTFLLPLSYIFKANVDVSIGDDEYIKNMEVAKHGMKRPMRKPLRRPEDNIKKHLGIRRCGLDSTGSGSSPWRFLMGTISLHVPLMERDFLINLATIRYQLIKKYSDL